MDQMIGVPKMSNREQVKFTLSVCIYITFNLLYINYLMIFRIRKARLTRIEDQMGQLNTKIEDCVLLLRSLGDSKSTS